MSAVGSAGRGIGMTSARTRRRLIDRLVEQGITNPAVLRRISEVPRHLFVDEALASRAYEDTALPIGFGQTISQPYVVALMTDAVLAGATEKQPLKVLEIGVGCGYQTAVLAPLVRHIFGVERIAPLLTRTNDRLKHLGVGNLSLRLGDGFKGWSSQGPFDAILLAAAPKKVPSALLQQLADGGRMVLPVGGAAGQSLLLIERTGDEFSKTSLGNVSFVPLVEGIDP